jgi:hypothetical protein
VPQEEGSLLYTECNHVSDVPGSLPAKVKLAPSPNGGLPSANAPSASPRACTAAGKTGPPQAAAAYRAPGPQPTGKGFPTLPL